MGWSRFHHHSLGTGLWNKIRLTTLLLHLLYSTLSLPDLGEDFVAGPFPEATATTQAPWMLLCWALLKRENLQVPDVPRPWMQRKIQLCATGKHGKTAAKAGLQAFTAKLFAEEQPLQERVCRKLPQCVIHFFTFLFYFVCSSFI